MKSVNEPQERVNPQWEELLRKAVTEPGEVLQAYHLFHSYSLGNAMAAAYQCSLRGIELGPVNTFQGWKGLGRCVRKGEKALSLCMPLTAKKSSTRDADAANATNTEDAEYIRCFAWKPHWFTLAQTEGAEYQMEPFSGSWDKLRAFEALDVQEVPFTHHDGNCQGFAAGRNVAVSPIAALPHKTLFHETAHVVLGHTLKSDCSDSAVLPRALREVEAESVAMLLCEALELSGADYCRGYIQHWWSSEPIPETSARRIFSAAHKILSAGTAQTL